MRKSKKGLWRPPISAEYENKVVRIMEMLNEDALRPFTPHETLVLLIDRGYVACFPSEADKNRKMYIKMPF